MSHFHVWVRSGRVFTMRLKQYATQQAAHKAAVKLRADPADRMVRGCSACPTSTRSRRPNWRARAERAERRVLELERLQEAAAGAAAAGNGAAPAGEGQRRPNSAERMAASAAAVAR